MPLRSAIWVLSVVVRVAIMGDACEQWMVCDQAAQALGAITFGIYPTASVSEVEYQMRNSEAAFFIAEDQEYVDKVLTIADRLSNLRSIVVIDSSAMFGYSDRRIVRLDDMLRAAGPLERGLPALDEMVTRLSPTDPAFIVYTSGTTGNPKGALISHGKHLAGAYTIVDLYPTLADKQHRTVSLSSAVSHVWPRCRDHIAADVTSCAALR